MTEFVFEPPLRLARDVTVRTLNDAADFARTYVGPRLPRRRDRLVRRLEEISEDASARSLRFICLFLAVIVLNLIFNVLSFIESNRTGTFDCADMHEHIFAAACRLNEPVTLWGPARDSRV